MKNFRWDKKYLYWGITAFSVIVCSISFFWLLNKWSSFTGVLACLSNTGPGLEAVGPYGSFQPFSSFSKLVFSLCMVLGRLEIMPILVLFSRNAWKKT